MSANATNILEEKVDLVRTAVLRNPLHREVLYKILDYCQERRLLNDLENCIADFPEFKAASQSQFTLITYLVAAGGLNTYELDRLGQPIAEEQKAGLSEDAVDDLVVDFAYQSTEAGLVVVQELSPRQRLDGLLAVTPAYHDTYWELLEFLGEKRSFAQIDTLLRGRDVLMANRDADDRPMQPSVFVDKLEKAGMIYWNNGWQTTEEGKRILASLVKRTEMH